MPAARTRLFDTILAVDWSAANAPKRGRDAIWIASGDHGAGGVASAPENPPTRSAAMARIAEMLATALKDGRRVLVGLDFAFGYPAGAALRIAGRADWRALWSFLHDHVEDGPDNRSNRFALAAAINRDRFGAPVYWGRPRQQAYDDLPARKPVGGLHADLAWRAVERAQPPAKSVWQLAYAGAVGSQALLGVARLEGLRRALGDAVRIWPFESGFAGDLSAPIVLAEIYPAMFPIAPRPGEPKDSAQVRAVAEALLAADANGALLDWLSPPAGADMDLLRRIVCEEGWIVGAPRR